MKRISVIMNVITVSFLAIVDSSTLPTNGSLISDSWQVTCEDAIGEADYYGMEVFGFGHRGTKIPVNLFDLKDHCPKAALAVSRLHDYADTCLHPLPRLLIRPLIDSNDDRDICKGIKNETTSLNHVQVKILDLFKCFDDNVDYFRKCASNFAHYINHVSRDENLKPNHKIEHVCKEYHIAYECINNQIEAKCSSGQVLTWKTQTDRFRHFTGLLCRFHPKESLSFSNLEPVSNSSHTDSFEFQSVIMALSDLYQTLNEVTTHFD